MVREMLLIGELNKKIVLPCMVTFTIYGYDVHPPYVHSQKKYEPVS